MREIRQSGSEGGGTKPIASPYPYRKLDAEVAPVTLRCSALRRAETYSGLRRTSLSVILISKSDSNR